MRRWLLGLSVLVIVGAAGVLVLRRPVRTDSAPGPAHLTVQTPDVDAGLSDEEVFARSMALLAEARRRAEAEAPVTDASTPPPAVRPDPVAAVAAPELAADAGIAPAVRSELEQLAHILNQGRYTDAVEQVHGLFRQRSPAAVPALEVVSGTAQAVIRGGGLQRIEPLLSRLQEVPTSEARVRTALARLLGTAATASGAAGQAERSKLQARAALALEERTAEAYLALGEYQFQDNDLAGAIDTWERGLRLAAGDPALTVRLARGRAEAQRLGGLERVESEHFVAAFDGRADVPAARATLELLERAYKYVGGVFELYPDGPIPVVLYPERTFEKEGHASWSAAVYDGKIRLPSAGADPYSVSFQRTLFHEYAHALFHRASGGTDAPTWLNEGFAQFAERGVNGGPPVLCHPDAHSFPLQRLEGGFQRLNRRTAWFAYLESLHAAERLVHLHGLHGVRSILAELSRGSPFPVAFQRAVGEDYATFAATFDAEVRR